MAIKEPAKPVSIAYDEYGIPVGVRVRTLDEDFIIAKENLLDEWGRYKTH